MRSTLLLLALVAIAATLSTAGARSIRTNHAAAAAHASHKPMLLPNATLHWWLNNDGCRGTPAFNISVAASAAAGGACTPMPEAEAAGTGFASVGFQVIDQVNNIFTMQFYSDAQCQSPVQYGGGEGLNSCLPQNAPRGSSLDISVFIQQEITDPYTWTMFDDEDGCVVTPTFANIFMQGGVQGPNVCYLGPTESGNLQLYQILTVDDASPPNFNLTLYSDPACTQVHDDPYQGQIGVCQLIQGDPQVMTVTLPPAEQLALNLARATHRLPSDLEQSPAATKLKQRAARSAAKKRAAAKRSPPSTVPHGVALD